MQNIRCEREGLKVIIDVILSHFNRSVSAPTYGGLVIQPFLLLRSPFILENLLLHILNSAAILVIFRKNEDFLSYELYLLSMS